MIEARGLSFRDVGRGIDLDGSGDDVRLRVQIRESEVVGWTDTPLHAARVVLEVDDLGLSQGLGDGIALLDSDAVIRGVMLDGVAGAGLYAVASTLELRDSRLGNAGASGLHLLDTDARVIGVDIEDAQLNGITQFGGNLFACLANILRAGLDGVWADSTSTGDVLDSLIARSGGRGFYAAPGAALNIGTSIVRASVGVGIQGARLVESTTIRGNNGGRELREVAGELDGVFETTLGDPIQVLEADSVQACRRNARLELGTCGEYYDLEINGVAVDVIDGAANFSDERYGVEVLNGRLTVELTVDGSMLSDAGVEARLVAGNGEVEYSSTGQGADWQFLPDGATEWVSAVRCPRTWSAGVRGADTRMLGWADGCVSTPDPVRARLELELGCEPPEPPPPVDDWDDWDRD